MSYQVDDSRSVLEVRYIGTVDDGQILECCQAIFDSEGFRTKHMLVDYTDVNSYNVTIPGLKRLTQFISENAPLDRSSTEHLNAYVVPKDIEYGMGRVFLAYMRDGPRSSLFRDRAEANDWLGLQPKPVAGRTGTDNSGGITPQI